MKVSKVAFLSATLLLGSVVVALPAHADGSLVTITNNIVNLVNGFVIPLVYALAFVFFLIGIVRYFFIEGGEEGQEKGKKFLIYGLGGLVLLFAIWGIVNLLLGTLTSLGGTS